MELKSEIHCDFQTTDFTNKMNTTSDSNCDFETIDFTISNKKCAEIFVKTDETFYIVCRFCIIPFTEFTQFTTHYAHNHSEKHNNLSNGECDQIDPIKIEPYDGLSDSNSNCFVLEINQFNDGVPNIIDSNANDDLLSNESNEIVKSTVTENKEISTKILNKRRKRKTSSDFNSDLCREKFLFEENVEKHKRNDHLPLDSFVDSKNVNNNSIEIDPKKCKYCDRKFSRKSERIIHERKHTGEKPFKCQFCDKLFSAKKHLKAHEKVHTAIKPFHCELCEKKFSTEENVVRHKKYDHLPFDLFVDSENVNNVCIENPRKCRYCGHIYKRKSQRIIHERKHTGEKPYKCGFCDKRFSCITHCKRHQKVHTGIKPFKCDVCDKAFAEKSNLIFHKRRHTGEKFYSCSYCDKTFIHGTQKKVHERVHTGERPYQCNSCGQCFTVISHLHTHTRSFHLSETEYKKPHKCEVCGKSFLTTGTLRNHAAKHTDLRPFPCEICSKPFKTKKALNVHKQIHSSEMKYVCQLCGKEFKQYPGLYGHMKSHGVVKN